jgi:hypothetical protein
LHDGRAHRRKHGIGVVHRLHRENRRRAAAQQLEACQPRRRRKRRRIVRRFHRPDAGAQPLEQTQVVGISAEQRLAEMNVRLHESGQQVAAGGVDHLVVTLGGFSPNRGDPAVAHGDCAVNDVEAVVHRQHGGVADQG